MYNNNNLFTALEANLSMEQMSIVRSVLHEYRKDENLLILENQYYILFQKEGILETFNSICQELGIEWNHSIDPLD